MPGVDENGFVVMEGTSGHVVANQTMQHQYQETTTTTTTTNQVFTTGHLGGGSEDLRYFSNESLEDRNSTTSSAEGSINVERRKVGMFFSFFLEMHKAAKRRLLKWAFKKL